LGRAIKLAACCVLACAGAFGQIDLVGSWDAQYHEDLPERRDPPGPEIGDYLGLPINSAARLRADSWDAAIGSMPERQCIPFPGDYEWFSDIRIWSDIDPATQKLIAYHTHRVLMGQERVIWMDGRPHPPEYAPHTWQGFSTGRWEGGMLTVTTTHLKESFIRRNGVPRSEKATSVQHFIRHENHLTVVTIVNDPVYLTEPFIRTTDYVLDLNRVMAPFPCEAVVEVERPYGSVPHHLPDANPFLAEFPARYGIPAEAARGGAETMYPEYRLKMSRMPAATRSPLPAR
jgi:hypothetical protein